MSSQRACRFFCRRSMLCAVIFPLVLLLPALLSALSRPEQANSYAEHPESIVASTATIWLVSLASDGSKGNAASLNPSLSADGRYVAFESIADNLVIEDTNGVSDIFVHDRLTGQTSRVSVASNGMQANGHSTEPSISADGRFVVFTSLADNLADEAGTSADAPLNPTPTLEPKPTIDRAIDLDVFVHDRQTGETTMVSVNSDGISATGKSWLPDISGDGSYVTFSSHANNLINPDNNDIKRDPFLHGRETGETWCVAVNSAGENIWSGGSHAKISADGNFIAFRSKSKELVSEKEGNNFDIFVYTRITRQVELVSIGTDGRQGTADFLHPAMSADGRYVVYDSASALVDNDTNGLSDIYVRDRETGTTTLISVASDGQQGNGASHHPHMAADGNLVIFLSLADNLVSNDNNGEQDLFLYDRSTGETSRISLATNGAEANSASQHAVISASGQFIAFVSNASNLDSSDTDGIFDVFLRYIGDDCLITPTPSMTPPLVTATSTITVSPSETPTATASYSPTPLVTETPTATASYSPTPTALPTSTPNVTPTLSLAPYVVYFSFIGRSPLTDK